MCCPRGRFCCEQEILRSQLSPLSTFKNHSYCYLWFHREVISSINDPAIASCLATREAKPKLVRFRASARLRLVTASQRLLWVFQFHYRCRLHTHRIGDLQGKPQSRLVLALYDDVLASLAATIMEFHSRLQFVGVEVQMRLQDFLYISVIPTTLEYPYPF